MAKNLLKARKRSRKRNLSKDFSNMGEKVGKLMWK
jgi:hypothetical protein